MRASPCPRKSSTRPWLHPQLHRSRRRRGVQLHGGGGRPPITAAAIACLFNAGDYDDKYVPKLMKYCEPNLGTGNPNLSFGHWHYAHYYYSQVLYREGGEKWKAYRNEIYSKLVNEANAEGYWDQGFIGAAYTTAINLTILQLDRGTLPIYQRRWTICQREARQPT